MTTCKHVHSLPYRHHSEITEAGRSTNESSDLPYSIKIYDISGHKHLFSQKKSHYITFVLKFEHFYLYTEISLKRR